MSPDTPFVDQDDWTIDLRQLFLEAVPLAVLVAIVGVVALVPLAIAFFVGVFPLAFALLGQFLLVVGTGVVLLYVVARGVQLAEG